MKIENKGNLLFDALNGEEKLVKEDPEENRVFMKQANIWDALKELEEESTLFKVQKVEVNENVRVGTASLLKFRDGVKSNKGSEGFTLF